MTLTQSKKTVTKDNTEPSSLNPKIRIGLMGPFGTGNLGDAAIQQAMIQTIQQYQTDAQIFGFSLIPEDTEKRHGIPSFPICKLGHWAHNLWWQGDGKNPWLVSLDSSRSRIMRTMPNSLLKKLIANLMAIPLEIFAWLRAYKNLEGLDLFIISGGGQLDDYWYGTWAHPFTLLMWGILAKLRRAKFLFVSVGAGPIDFPLSRLFIKAALLLADYRSYRDRDSQEYLAKVVNLNKKDAVYPDLAHSLQITNYPTLKLPNNKSVIGIGPMTYFDPRVWPEQDRSIYQTYLTKLATFVTWLLQKQYHILFFPGEVRGDLPVIQDLKEILERQGVNYTDGQIVEESIQTVDDLMLQLARTDLVIASRFHGVLLPMLLNKPVLALSYHPKIDHLMTDTGQAEYCLSIENFDIETLKECFTQLETNQESIKKQLAKRIQEYRSALDEQYERLFKNL